MRRGEKEEEQNQIGVVLVNSGYGGLQKLNVQLLIVRVGGSRSQLDREKRDPSFPSILLISRDDDLLKS